MLLRRLCLLACLPLLAPATARAATLIDDFEDVGDWAGVKLERALVRQGKGAGRWDDHIRQTSITKQFPQPLDLSAARKLEMWVYSQTANQAGIQIVFDSDDPRQPGSDYYSTSLIIDWTGWRRVSIPLAAFAPSRSPLGWNRINYLRLSADGWNHTPLASTVLIFDGLGTDLSPLVGARRETAWKNGDFVVSYRLDLADGSGKARALSLAVATGPGSPLVVGAQPAQVVVPANGRASAVATLTVPAAAAAKGPLLAPLAATLSVSEGGELADEVSLAAALPPPSRPRPRLFAGSADFTRVAAWAASDAWAAKAQADILAAADAYPAAYKAKYGLANPDLPPEGGQWSLWYVCPKHGVRLRTQSPTEHLCPVDNTIWKGWPYDQVIYGSRHDDLARAARDLGLAYRLTGKLAYAQAAADILRAYAARYGGYPLHDRDGKLGNSGARVQAQTLDESGWLIQMAWAFDLVADVALTPAERTTIEDDLLDAGAAVIARNPAGASNWQSWHNAAFAAVAVATDDPLWLREALLGPGGFEFQMGASVTPDGFWYEGAWGYHYFALDALWQLAEAATRAGYDAWARPPLRKMFFAPIDFAMPDGTLPAFNDSGTVALSSAGRHYEVAYGRIGDPRLTLPIGARGREGLLFGARTLPGAMATSARSQLFADSGYAVLRATGGANDPSYLALDFGPHGGGHGHYDKLGFVYHALGKVVAIDPGTQSYAAPTHTTWDKVTLAHNTVVVDGATQAEATGRLHRFVALGSLGMAAADAGPAYANARLLRTVVLTPGYLVDRFRVVANDGKSHAIDWAYHAPGALTTALPLMPYAGLPMANGYQHVQMARAATTNGDFAVTFATDVNDLVYGTPYKSDPRIGGAFLASRDRAVTGAWSGRLAYDFTAATGYLLYSTRSPDPVAEVPTAVRLQVWGDGSKNKLTLRLNDATGERFTRLVGAVDWNGWRAIEASDPAKWSHYLGNNDGIVDLPIANVGIELASGGAASGALYVDDVRLLYPQAGERLVEGFEVSAPSVGLRFVGEAGTTVVAGLGLGPDLQKPLPMVLVRRSASETTFQALIEPAAEAPQVTSFQALPTSAAAADEAGAFAIASPQFSDRLLVVADGAPGVLRRFGGEACDGTLCFLRRDAGGQLSRVALGQGQRLESGMTPLVTAMARVGDLEVEYLGAKLRLTSRSGAAGELKIYAPAAMQVELNGGPAPFQRMNEYVLIGAVPAPDLAMAPPADLAVAPVADLAVAPPVDLGAPAADLAVAAGDAAAVAVDLQAPSLDGASPLVEGGAGDGPAAAADLAAAGAAGDLATASADGPTLPSDARGCACSVGAQPKAGAQGWLLAALLAVAALRRIGRRGAARGR